MAFCVSVSPIKKAANLKLPLTTCITKKNKYTTNPASNTLRCSIVLSGMSSTSSLLHQFGQAVIVNSSLFAIAKAGKQKVLTKPALFSAFVLGVLLWTCLSWPGYTLCFAFLIFGSAVTKIGRAEKEALGIAEKRGGARGPENLWGAAGAAAICAASALTVNVLSQVFPRKKALCLVIYRLLILGYTAALATKMSDTAASEIGKAFGSTTYLVTTLRVVPKGTEGAVSLEGTVAGVMASVLAALYGLAVGLLGGWVEVAIVIIAAFVATTAESFIGAAIQEQYNWTNEFVNFVNTTIGALVAMFLRSCLIAF